MNMKSDKPVRLAKKTPLKEKFVNKFTKYYPYLLLTLMILIFILLLVTIILYFPATESGQYYNRFGGVLL